MGQPGRARPLSGDRFRRQDRGSFFGDLIYDRVVPMDHFLRQPEELVPWDRFTRERVKFYRGRARQGGSPYDPVVLLKMPLVAYPYDLSEPETEVVASEGLSIKWFRGPGPNEVSPNHSTLTAFKCRLVDNGQVGPFDELLAETMRLAQERGVPFGSTEMIDSVHTVANVNVGKDRQWRKTPRRRPA